jgi:hypothetical protein
MFDGFFLSEAGSAGNAELHQGKLLTNGWVGECRMDEWVSDILILVHGWQYWTCINPSRLVGVKWLGG